VVRGSVIGEGEGQGEESLSDTKKREEGLVGGGLGTSWSGIGKRGLGGKSRGNGIDQGISS